MFVVQAADMERLTLSNEYIDELRSLPEDHLSSKDAQCERHLASYTTMDVVKQSDLNADVCRAPLSHNLGWFTVVLLISSPRMLLKASLIASLFDETQFALEKIALVKCNSDTEEYTFAPTYPLMTDILNRIMSRALVGYPGVKQV
ncbi:hypothetical protein EAE96_003106 [Botrytis aclada]|nr:hypothetical protein EAE96_003106 [Botrytis aclada]